MATENLEKIVKTLSDLKVTDLAKLKKLLEEEWGVEAAAMAAAPAAAPAAEGGAGAPAASESTDFQVTLTEVSTDKKIGVIKVVREVTGLGLKEAKDIAENPPKVLKESAPKAEADEILKKLEGVGAKGTLKGL